MVSLAAVIVLLTINGFFVAAEFALVKARGVRIEDLSGEENAPARLTVAIQQNLEAYLATCQLGITMASLGLGWVGVPAVAVLLEPVFLALGMPIAVLHSVAFIIGFLIFLSLHIVFGQQLPKTLAIRNAKRVSLWVAYPLHCSYLLVRPLNWLLNKASSSILSLFEGEEASHGEVYSDEELKGLVNASRDRGRIEYQKADRLHSLFEFEQRSVGRVMIPRNGVQVLDVAALPEENRRVALEFGHSCFPLIDSSNNDEILGVILAKVIYRAMVEEERDPWERLEDFCQLPLVVPESQKIAQLFELMREKHIYFAFLVDEYGELSGIVTLEDLLEEIVGE